jgi:hypothetical protein
MITIFLTSLLIVPSVFVFGGSIALANIDGPLESQASLAQLPHNARIAIYDESNLTVPNLSLAENLTNDIAEVTTLLEGAGHTVEPLSTSDILNHELMTADYDIFILANQLPRESINDLVREFWLGGGGFMLFNGSLSYLFYGEILLPGSTDDLRGPFWNYWPTDSQNVTVRHPTMKDYHTNDTVYESGADCAVIWGPYLDGLDNANDYTHMLHNTTHVGYVTGFAREANTEGGRLVYLPTASSIAPDMESIILDSMEWLIPRPKGRIVFDMTHSPRIGIDHWDEPLITVWTSLNSFTQFRTLAVNHSYTFDKLYPLASGNLTAERLAKYDVLVINWPDLDYMSTERAAVEAWIEGGGCLLALGDRTGMSGGGPGDTYMNQLLQNFDMGLGTTDDVAFESMTPGTHVTLEGCTLLYMGPHNYLSVIGNATELWFDGTDPVVAAEEFGQGRAILSADMNIFDNQHIVHDSNVRFALNVLNWLTAADADILAFTSFQDDMPAALRDLGLSYQLFTINDYLDDFLDSEDWGLVILDQSNSWYTDTQLNYIYSYVDNGGRLIMSYMGVDAEDTHPLWSKLGFDYSATLSGTPDMYIWDTSHRIFTEPNNRNGVNFTSNVNFADDGDTLTVLDGFTALAGSSATVQDGNALIVLKNDYQTLYNGYLIDTCTSDEDDSTYRDSVEIWQNEIAFMLNPPSPDGFTLPFDTTTLLIIGGAVIGIIVIGVVASRRRGGGSSKPKKKPAKKKKK